MTSSSPPSYPRPSEVIADFLDFLPWLHKRYPHLSVGVVQAVARVGRDLAKIAAAIELPVDGRGRRPYQLTEEGRERISRAQRRRWARARKAAALGAAGAGTGTGKKGRS